jgi:hypothetical protein
LWPLLVRTIAELLTTVGQSVETAVFAATTLIASVSVEEGGWGLSVSHKRCNVDEQLQEIAYLLVGLSICYLILAPTTLNVLSAKMSKEKCLFISLSRLALLTTHLLGRHLPRQNQQSGVGSRPRHLLNAPCRCQLLLDVGGRCNAADSRFYDMIAIETSTAELLSSTNACLTLFGVR